MATTLNSSGVQFPDGTTQTSAISTNTVLNATAGASVGAVGTYALMRAMNFQLDTGSTYAGSNLRYGGMGFGISSGSTNSRGSTRGDAPAGTWRAMGFAQGTGLSDVDPSTLMLRIS